MALERSIHWATREFHHFLLARAHRPFAWGVNDCALFAADGIQAMTGVDIAAEFRGKYDDEIGAFRAIAQIAGGTNVADAAAYCAHKHGLRELGGPLYAQRGDLVIVVESGRPLAALVHLNGRHAVTVGERGILRLPIQSVRRAWRV